MTTVSARGGGDVCAGKQHGRAAGADCGSDGKTQHFAPSSSVSLSKTDLCCAAGRSQWHSPGGSSWRRWHLAG